MSYDLRKLAGVGEYLREGVLNSWSDYQAKLVGVGTFLNRGMFICMSEDRRPVVGLPKTGGRARFGRSQEAGNADFAET